MILSNRLTITYVYTTDQFYRTEESQRVSYEYATCSMMQFRMMLELIAVVLPEPQLWLFPTSLCHCSQGAPQAALRSALQSRAAVSCGDTRRNSVSGLNRALQSA